MSDVAINYKGSSLATMDASGTKTLLTEGKYCEDDIEVVYDKPAGPSGTKQISITQNGTTTEDVAAYANAEITVNVSGGGGISVDGFASGDEPSGAVTITATTLRDYCFYKCLGITSLTIANDIPWRNWGMSAFSLCTNLVSVFAPNLTQLRQKVFNGCSALANTSFPKVTTIEGDQSIESTAVETLVFPAFTGRVYSASLRFNTRLTAVDLNACTEFGSSCFNGCTALATLIIRGSTIPTLGNVNAFANTPFKSGGTGGTIYIPKSLYDHLGDGTSSDYQAATNWSTVHGYGTITWAKIEGSTYETHYADGTVIPSS